MNFLVFDGAEETPDGMLINGDSSEVAGGNTGVRIGDEGGDNDKDMGGSVDTSSGDLG